MEPLLIQTFKRLLANPSSKFHRSIAVTDGSYVSVGYTSLSNTAFLYRVSSDNVGTFVTNANKQYRSVMQYDSTTLYVVLLDTSLSNNYIQTVSTSLVFGTAIVTSYDSTYDIFDGILSSDSKIMVVGIKSGTTAFIAKISITATSVWYTDLVLSGTPNMLGIMMKKDGSFLVSDSHTISGKQYPYLSSVSNSGAINWEATYTGNAYDIYIFAMQMYDDYTVTLGGGWNDGTKARPIMIKVTLACPPNYTVNALSTACIIVCNPGYYKTSDTNCSLCAAGAYTTTSTTSAAPTTTSCTLCSQGYYQSQTGQTSCVACPINQIINDLGATKCIACGDGQYQCSTGGTSCIPCPGSHCGVCKLHDRSLCNQLVGVCWPSYDDKCANLSISDDCVTRMASICYKIWLVNGTNDTQCADFVNYFNFTLMQLNASLINAYYKEDGQSFVLEFDQDISQAGFSDASSVFRFFYFEMASFFTECSMDKFKNTSSCLLT